jgi:hypothetical protein
MRNRVRTRISEGPAVASVDHLKASELHRQQHAARSLRDVVQRFPWCGLPCERVENIQELSSHDHRTASELGAIAGAYVDDGHICYLQLCARSGIQAGSRCTLAEVLDSYIDTELPRHLAVDGSHSSEFGNSRWSIADQSGIDVQSRRSA